MSIDLGAEQHPLLACFEAIDVLLDEVASVDPIYLRTSDKKAVLTLGARVEARMAALKMRVLATADDIAIETGDRSDSVVAGQPDS